jgi:hypothetical protein
LEANVVRREEIERRVRHVKAMVVVFYPANALVIGGLITLFAHTSLGYFLVLLGSLTLLEIGVLGILCAYGMLLNVARDAIQDSEHNKTAI